MRGQNRSASRYERVAVDFETKLVARMTKLAEQHPRWGYRMVHGLLVEEFMRADIGREFIATVLELLAEQKV